jgi:hypothetical protein
MESLSLDIPALHLNPRLEVEAVERKRGRYNRYSQNHILQNIHTLNFKGIDQQFKGRLESRLIRSVLTNWGLSYFFGSYFKGPS